MEILIDTNFAVTCTKQKIDFFNLINQIVEEPVFWIIPQSVLEEIKKISLDHSQKIKDRHAAALFLEMFETNLKEMKNLEVITLPNPVVDNALAHYCKNNLGTVLATLDKKLKSRVKNPLLVIQGKKFLEIQKNIKSKGL